MRYESNYEITRDREILAEFLNNGKPLLDFLGAFQKAVDAVRRADEILLQLPDVNEMVKQRGDLLVEIESLKENKRFIEEDLGGLHPQQAAMRESVHRLKEEEILLMEKIRKFSDKISMRNEMVANLDANIVKLEKRVKGLAEIEGQLKKAVQTGVGARQ